MNEKYQIIKKLDEELQKCNKCPFLDFEMNQRETGVGRGKLGAWCREDSDCTVMVIGQNPSYRRYEGSHCYSGRQGDPFRKIFGEDHLVFTNFVQISTKDNKLDSLTDEDYIHCISHLLNEIIKIKPKVIIISSSLAKNKLTEMNIDIHEELKKHDKHNTEYTPKLFFIKHPDYYLTYQRNNVDEYYKIL